ncbi:inactive leucine-rich repeat receptor-like serine/threonine-protein kinase at5g24100 [Phtheirospermum japonicum]|uniref:Inactive leucine-rich repeat receptor-like serine/threonine-protein kinase at5g24100 n=1 Tax=Phtheirospermum japonicum TaxID=374723 RepID=A0A830BL09_9LAMI|nr:inactive leucine-rich repeat receptor-like serine/threonine-protein kinase at5g24100 [Phtheirospermum japonicum]
MSANYDNWERLVGAVLKKQQLWELFHDHSRSPSLLSEASDFNPSFNSRSPLYDLDFDFARLGSLSRSHTACSKLVVISDFRPAIDVKDVSSAEFLGRGTFGSTYAAVMDIGLRVVVKILKSTIISEPDFKRHMDIIKNVSHANVTPLRAYMLPKMNASC